MSRAKVYSSSSVSVWTCLFSARSFRSSEGFREPTSGGVIERVGAMNFAMRAIRRPNFGVAPRELRDRLERVFFVPAIEEVPPIGQGQETGFLWDDLEAVRRQVEISDDLRPEEAAHVRANGEL